MEGEEGGREVKEIKESSRTWKVGRDGRGEEGRHTVNLKQREGGGGGRGLGCILSFYRSFVSSLNKF